MARDAPRPCSRYFTTGEYFHRVFNFRIKAVPGDFKGSAIGHSPPRILVVPRHETVSGVMPAACQKEPDRRRPFAPADRAQPFRVPGTA
jgi:hypothetical protein